MSESHSTKICSFEGCGNKVSGRGLCGGHWAQWKKGKQLAPLFSTRRRPGAPHRTDAKCAHCKELAIKVFKRGHYCVIHYRIKQMRYDAQASGKSIPDASVLESMITECVNAGMTCPACKRQMNWMKKEGISTMMTLQHDRDGSYRLICLGCNTRHQHFPGDSFYQTPTGHKPCTRCKVVKPFSEFYRHKHNGVNGRSSYCKKCSLADTKERQQKKRSAAK